LTPRTVLARTFSLTASSPTYLRGRRSPSERRRFVTGWHVVRGRQRGAARQWAWPAVVVAMMIAGALVWLGTRQGVGASSDSAVYVSGARNLADGDEFVSFSLQPITTFPPGFPITLAAGDRLGVDPAEGARALDVVAFGALVLLTFLLARRHVVSPWLCVWTAAAVAFAPALLGVYTYAWSEPVFNVLVLAMLLIVEPLMVRRGRDPVLLFLAAVVAGVAFSYRYAGITVLALPAIVILASAWRDGFRALLARTSTYVGLAMVVPALVVARNLSDGAAVLGDRGTSDETLGGVAQDMMRTFHEWALRSESSLLGYVALAGAGVVMTFGLGIAVRRRTRGHRGEGAPLLPEHRPRRDRTPGGLGRRLARSAWAASLGDGGPQRHAGLVARCIATQWHGDGTEGRRERPGLCIEILGVHGTRSARAGPSATVPHLQQRRRRPVLRQPPPTRLFESRVARSTRSVVRRVPGLVRPGLRRRDHALRAA
jgi:hypothetical protein